MAKTAFVDVTVVPMDDERLLDHHTVLVDGDRIVSIAPAGAGELAEDIERIDGRGRFLMPGLVDMHVHYNEPGFAALFVAHGVTTVRNMWGLPVHLQARDVIARGGGFGPAIYTCGPIMDGDPPQWPGSAVIRTAKEAACSVAEQKQQGYDFLKVYNSLSLEAYDAIISAGRQHGMPVVGHVPAQVGLAHALASQQASIEHLHGYLPALLAADAPEAHPADITERFIYWTEHVDEAKIAGVVAATVDAAVWNCVTLIVNAKMGPARLSFDQECERMELRYLSRAYLEGWKATTSRPIEDPDRAIAAYRRSHELRSQLVRAMRDAGARLLLGSDTPNPFVIPGVSVHDELALLVEAGLSPYEALRAGTRDAAEFLGATGEFGSVAEGLGADLLLVQGNPLEDVRNAGRRAGVMVRGRWYPEAELQGMLEDVARSREP
jgi:imidazolonepropionase-like amidohydrolase